MIWDIKNVNGIDKTYIYLRLLPLAVICLLMFPLDSLQKKKKRKKDNEQVTFEIATALDFD